MTPRRARELRLAQQCVADIARLAAPAVWRATVGFLEILLAHCRHQRARLRLVQAHPAHHNPKED